MADVTVKVGGRSYVVGCGAGEELRVAALAKRLDTEAGALAGGVAVPEARLLLMTALVLADKLDEAEAALAARPEPQPGLFDADEAEAAVATLDEATRRIESLAAGGDDDGGDPAFGEGGLSRAERRALRRTGGETGE